MNKTIFVSNVDELQEQYKQAREIINLVSPSSWIDPERGRAYVCSTKSFAGTYGQPEDEISIFVSL